MFTLPVLVASLTFVFLLAASWFDLRTGEIPDKITLGLTAVMIVFAGFVSLLESNISFIFFAVLVGLFYFILAYILYYLGEWGGGDVKLIAGVGCSLGLLKVAGYLNEGLLPYYADYLVNIALVSSPYVLVYTLVLGLLKPSVFTVFRQTLKSRVVQLLLFVSALPFVSAYFIGLNSLAFLYLMIPFFVLLSVYLKVVEKEALQKTVGVDELEEEDVVAEDLFVDGVKLASSRDISGLTGVDIDKIRALADEGRIPKSLRIKWGVRFAPIFFFAYVLSVFYGNALEVLVVYLVGL